jgi:hypothetical protein
MQKWEHLLVEYENDLSSPSYIRLWPPGLINLDWVREKFGVKVFYEEGPRDVIGRLFGKHPLIVSLELLTILQDSGWEVVNFSTLAEDNGRTLLFFKRPVPSRKRPPPRVLGEGRGRRTKL